MFSPSAMFLNFFFAHENMKKAASKVAKPAQIQPKFQFLFHKNLPPRDFSIMTLFPRNQKTIINFDSKNVQSLSLVELYAEGLTFHYTVIQRKAGRTPDGLK